LSYEGIATLYLYYQIAQNSTIIVDCVSFREFIKILLEKKKGRISIVT